MSEQLGPWVIEGPAGYRTPYGWSKMRASALSFDDQRGARDWFLTTQPRIGEVKCVPFNAEAEHIERINHNLPLVAAQARHANDYDPFNDGPR